MTASAFDGASELRFLVLTFPALENSLSLGTEVAGTARRRRATAATPGNFGGVVPPPSEWALLAINGWFRQVQIKFATGTLKGC